jgi:hypothetical protein
MTAHVLLYLFSMIAGQDQPPAGSIRGVVVNASQDMAPLAGAEVVLRVRLEGQFAVAAKAVADAHGRFAFDNIPADANYIYLPGANREGVHYPGPRIRLSRETPHAQVRLPVHDTVSHPSPLVLRRHEIVVQPDTDVLRVKETLLIDNPGLRTWVGQPVTEGGRAATLRLSIPEDFLRTTFQGEFYGSQFTLIDGKLVTDIPWTPGQRELTFTYVLANSDRCRVWQRPLDLPCDLLRLQVDSDRPGEVSSNLPLAESALPGSIVFESAGQTLPAGHVVRLQLGSLPVSMVAYARWLALLVLALLTGTTFALGAFRRGRRRDRSQGTCHGFDQSPPSRRAA